MSFVMPSTFTLFTFTPSSSITSRFAQCSISSPNSKCPPGSAHMPAPCEFCLRIKINLSSLRLTNTPTPIFGSSMFNVYLLVMRLVGIQMRFSCQANQLHQIDEWKELLLFLVVELNKLVSIYVVSINQTLRLA